MEVTESMRQINLQSELIAIGIVVVALLLILYLNRHKLQIRFREWRTRRALNRIGNEQIRNFVCPDGLDGHYSIQRLALTPDAILLINYKPYVGNIYCAERISEWTQVVGQKSFKFTNPLFELENQMTALKLAVGGVPLRGYLLFSHSAVFPKGHPDSVLLPHSIPATLLKGQERPVKAEVQAAWEHLKWAHSNGVDGGELRAKT